MAIDVTGLSLALLLSPEFLADPTPLYRRLREESPVHWDAAVGSFLISRYADVHSALQDPRFSSERVMANLQRQPPEIRDKVCPVYKSIARQIMYVDPPAHARLRGLLSPAFSSVALHKWQPRVERLAAELIESATQQAEFDVIGALAYPLPMTVITDLLGVPRADQSQFKKWSLDFASFIGAARLQPEQAAAAVAGIRDFIAYFQDLVATRRRGAAADDLLSMLMGAEVSGGVLDDEELYTNCVFLLAAGHETTTNLIGNAVYLLLRHPAELARLRADPALVDSTIEEALRYEGSTRWTSRILREDVELHGQVLRKGQSVLLLLAAANRDPQRFAEPDRFDIGRRDNRHLGFGFGPHFCLGAALARLEARAALRGLLHRCPRLLLGETPDRWIPSVFFRGLSALPVRSPAARD